MKRFLPVLLCGLVALSGCDRIDRQRSKRAADRASQRASDGDYLDAIRYYEEALDGTVATAELHYRMALICDDRLNDPLGALFHFKRYLVLAPEGKFAKDAKSFIREDELKLVTMLSKGALMTQREAASLRNDNLELRKQTTELRARVKTLQELNRSSGRAVPVAEPVKKPIPPGSRTYVVQPGDTLAAISRHFYKTSARWKDIQDANFNALQGTVTLKPGMELIIPD